MHAMSKKRSRTVEKRDPKTIAFWAFMVVALIAGVSMYAVAQARVPEVETADRIAVPDLVADEVTLPPIATPPGTRAVFFGDSWTYGYAAEPITQGYAYQAGTELGWDYTVNGGSGTGYLNAGQEGKGTYLDRLRKLPIDPAVQVLVLQGGLNDSGITQPNLQDAARATIAEARTRFPSATIVMLGPAPAKVPPSGGLLQVNADLSNVAAIEGLRYITSIDWIDTVNYGGIIDTTKKDHPSTEGHAFLAGRVVEAINGLQGK
jgi:lysophospholipase L1-like esterase